MFGFVVLLQLLVIKFLIVSFFLYNLEAMCLVCYFNHYESIKASLKKWVSMLMKYNFLTKRKFKKFQKYQLVLE